MAEQEEEEEERRKKREADLAAEEGDKETPKYVTPNEARIARLCLIKLN